MFYQIIKKSRKKMDKDLAFSHKRKLISPIYYAQYKITIPLTLEYIHDDLIDIGCGYSPYRQLLKDKVNKIDGYDHIKYNEFVTILGDILNISTAIDRSYDCAICFEVLEHSPDPSKTLEEIHKVLNSKGFLALSVPLFNQVHEEPLDFFRFTKYGIIELLKSNGFNIINVKKKAGLFSFLGHQISIFFNSLFWPIPLINHLILYSLFILVVLPSYWLDKVFDKQGKFAQGYVVIAQKD